MAADLYLSCTNAAARASLPASTRYNAIGQPTAHVHAHPAVTLSRHLLSHEYAELGKRFPSLSTPRAGSGLQVGLG